MATSKTTIFDNLPVHSAGENRNALFDSCKNLEKLAAAVDALGEILCQDPDRRLELTETGRDGLGCLLSIIGDGIWRELENVPCDELDLNQLFGNGKEGPHD